MDETTNAQTTATTEQTEATPVSTETAVKPDDTAAPANTETTVETPDVDYKALWEKEKAERAKIKASLDKASSELSAKKKADRANMTELERLKDETTEQIEALKAENEKFKQAAAIASISKSAMTFVRDETTATEVAEMLYGAKDVDGVFAIINKEWTARERALRVEYGKIPAPGAGNGEMSPEEIQHQKYIELARSMAATTAGLAKADNGLGRFI